MSATACIVFSNTAQQVVSFHLISAATTNATVIKAAPGFLASLYLSNANAAVRFVKFYDKATAPTVGTDIPVFTILVPINGTIFQNMPSGLKFNNGISFATTVGIADSDVAVVAVGDLAINGQFQ